jgi:hypothetical protein
MKVLDRIRINGERCHVISCTRSYICLRTNMDSRYISIGDVTSLTGQAEQGRAFTNSQASAAPTPMPPMVRLK